MTQPTRAEYDQVMIPCYKPADLVMTHGKKCRLYDSQNRSYLDFGGGIAVNSLGNAPKIVRKALKAQSAKLCHISNVFTNDATLKLAKRLTSLTGFDRVFFTNSGAESNEAALKLARRTAFDDYGEQKDEIISFTHSFHGRTFFTVCVGGQDKYSSGFGPRPGAITHLPFNDIGAFEKQISDRTCAVIFEPVQGEGGFNVAPKELVAAIRRLCDEHGIVMIADEVQSGFARTGKLFAMDHYADKPDLMTMAKSLAGGMPLSGVVGNANIMDAPAPGGLGGTYAGNPLAVAAAHAVLNIIDKESLCERANQLGQRLKNTLIDAKESVPAIAAVRGLGSMIAVEFNDPQTGEPSAAIAQKIQQRALAQGLLLLTCGAYGNVIRFLYPLTIPDAQFDAAMKILQDALSD